MKGNVHTKECFFSCCGCIRYVTTYMSEGSYRRSPMDDSYGRASRVIPLRYLYKGSPESYMNLFHTAIASERHT
jgi:hypothetical protein